jgi:hypothetical protein
MRGTTSNKAGGFEAAEVGGVMHRVDMAELCALTAQLVAAMTAAEQQRNERHQHPRLPRRPVSRRPMRCSNGLVAAQIVGGSAASPTTTTAAALTELKLGAESAATSANAEPETDIEPPAQASATITPATKNASIAAIAEARYDSDVTIVKKHKSARGITGEVSLAEKRSARSLPLSAKTPICVADEGDSCDDSNEGAPLERQMDVPSGEESGYRKEADSGKNAESRDRRKDVYMDFEGLVRRVAREDRRAPYCRTGQNRGLIAPRLNGPAGKEKTNVKDLARRPAPSLATRIDDMDNGWSGKAEGWWAKSKGDKATVRGGCMHCHIPCRVRRRRRRNWRKRKAVAHINQVGGEKSPKYVAFAKLNLAELMVNIERSWVEHQQKTGKEPNDFWNKQNEIQQLKQPLRCFASVGLRGGL